MPERNRPRVLVIDDGESYAQVVREQLPELELLEPAGSLAGRFVDGPSALAYLKRHPTRAQVVLLDLNFDLPEARLLPLPEAGNLRRLRRFQGVAILRALRAQLPALPVVLLTSERDLSLGEVAAELASQSMTYLLEGDDLDALRIRIHGALSDAEEGPELQDVLWGKHAGLSALRRRLRVLSRGGMPLLLEGETGTGKSYLAERFVHVHSARKGPFVVLDLASVPENLVAAQLFGAVRGAYTGAVADVSGVFEAAHGGTLFIDEVQNIPLEVQKQLLLVLQNRSVTRLGSTRPRAVDVKVVAASNGTLQDAVAQGRFRADLYMRLSPATRVQLPALRERAEDLAFLARRFVQLAARDPDLGPLVARVAGALDPALGTTLELGLPGQDVAAGLALVLPPAAWNRLRSHGWPGNLRELSMVMHNLVSFTLLAAVDALESGVKLRSARLQVDAGLVGELLAGSSALGGAASGAAGAASSAPAGLTVRLEPHDTLNAVAQDVERQYMVALFEQTRGDLGLMAERLLGDASRRRAVRLRLNQLGLKIRALRGG
jgi:DNA-binding NtrC family response regulator